MKKLFSLIVMSILLQSCDKVYDIQERYTIDVNVTDSQNNPLPAIDVEVYPEPVPYFFGEVLPDFQDKGLFFIGGDDYDLINFGQTNVNGQLRLHLPAPNSGLKNLSVFLIDRNEQFKPLKVAVDSSSITQQYLSISAQKLYSFNNLVNLFINFDLSENTRLVAYSLNGNIAFNEINFSDLPNLPSFEQENTFDVQKNQIIQLSYTLEEFAPTEIITINEQVLITIEEDNLEYNIQNP